MNIDEIRVWDGVRYRKAIGKVMTANGLKDFYRPIDFETDFVNSKNMNRQTAKTLTSKSVNAGNTVIPVRDIVGFSVGEVITITDGVSNENIAVCGENLILDSNNFPLDGSDNGNRNLTVIKEDENGESYFSVTPVYDGNIYWNRGMRFSEPRVAGQEYTITFDIMTTQSSSWGFYLYTTGLTNVSDIPSTNGEWIRYSYTFTQEVTEDNDVLFGFYNLEAGQEIGWRKLKLEKGNVATEWTSAPEDLFEIVGDTLSVSELKNNYQKNSIVARSTAKIDGAFSYGTIDTYNIEEV